MVIERFWNREAIPAYRRFREKGRMTPNGLAYVESWWEATLTAAFNRRTVRMRRSGTPFAEFLGQNHQRPSTCCARRRRVTNAASLGRSCSVRAVNFNPNPVPAREWRTMASARI